jgi:hypothetical protein
MARGEDIRGLEAWRIKYVPIFKHFLPQQYLIAVKAHQRLIVMAYILESISTRHQSAMSSISSKFPSDTRQI